jgi:hypothetical protein
VGSEATGGDDPVRRIMTNAIRPDGVASLLVGDEAQPPAAWSGEAPVAEG